MTDVLSAGCSLGAIAFVALGVYAHSARPDLDRLAVPLSALFAGRTRGAMLLAYAFLSIGLACSGAKLLATGLSAAVPVVTEASAMLVWIAATCLLLIALTARRTLDSDTRSERVKTLHRAATRIALSAVAVAMVAYSVLGFPSEHRDQRTLRTVAVLVSMFAAAVFLLLLQMSPGVRRYGLVQKILVLLVVTWMWLIAAV